MGVGVATTTGVGVGRTGVITSGGWPTGVGVKVGLGVLVKVGVGVGGRLPTAPVSAHPVVAPSNRAAARSPTSTVVRLDMVSPQEIGVPFAWGVLYHTLALRQHAAAGVQLNSEPSAAIMEAEVGVPAGAGVVSTGRVIHK
jgi:hypothetical protein